MIKICIECLSLIWLAGSEICTGLYKKLSSHFLLLPHEPPFRQSLAPQIFYFTIYVVCRFLYPMLLRLYYKQTTYTVRTLLNKDGPKTAVFYQHDLIHYSDGIVCLIISTLYSICLELAAQLSTFF